MEGNRPWERQPRVTSSAPGPVRSSPNNKAVSAMPEPRQDDYLDKDGATLLGKRIAAYWASCGRSDVEIWIEFAAVPGGFAWVVKSDLKGGLPRPTAVT
jgi:hypothetical protein